MQALTQRPGPTTLLGRPFVFSGDGMPLVFDAGAVVALDATTWYDAFYLRHEIVPAVPTLESILLGANARWYDTRSL